MHRNDKLFSYRGNILVHSKRVHLNFFINAEDPRIHSQAAFHKSYTKAFTNRFLSTVFFLCTPLVHRVFMRFNYNKSILFLQGFSFHPPFLFFLFHGFIKILPDIIPFSYTITGFCMQITSYGNLCNTGKNRR